MNLYLITVCKPRLFCGAVYTQKSRLKKSGCCNTATELQWLPLFWTQQLLFLQMSAPSRRFAICQWHGFLCRSSHERFVWFIPTVRLNSLIAIVPLKLIDFSILNVGMTEPLIKGKFWPNGGVRLKVRDQQTIKNHPLGTMSSHTRFH